MITTSTAAGRIAALAIAASLALPLAACQRAAPVEPGQAPVAPAEGFPPLVADRIEHRLERARLQTMPDRPERMGILRWCSVDPSSADAVERSAAKRHCLTLRGY